MPTFALGDLTPQIAPDVFVAPTACIIGQAVLEEHSSVWWNAVIRADVERVHIGPRCNVQDGAVLHADPGFPLELEDEVTVGHRATVHGAWVGSGALIGIGATVLNGARIGRGCLVAAHAVVLEGTEVPEAALLAGAPAKVKRIMTPEEVERVRASATRYVQNGVRYRQHLKALG